VGVVGFMTQSATHNTCQAQNPRERLPSPR
jgi:hypothetical protein